MKMKERLEGIIKNHRIDCAVAFKDKSSDVELADKILSSGYVHIEDVLRCFDDFYKQQGLGRFIDIAPRLRQALENLGKDEK